jgi:hypothetical protein
MEEHSPNVVDADRPSGLKTRELVQWALDEGMSCLVDLNPTQEGYLQAVSRTAGVKWPAGFFDSTLDQLMDRRFS